MPVFMIILQLMGTQRLRDRRTCMVVNTSCRQLKFRDFSLTLHPKHATLFFTVCNPLIPIRFTRFARPVATLDWPCTAAAAVILSRGTARPIVLLIQATFPGGGERLQTINDRDVHSDDDAMLPRALIISASLQWRN